MYRELTDLPSSQEPSQTMKCFIGIEKQLKNYAMFYRDPVQIDKDWSNRFRFFCSRNKSDDRVLWSLKFMYFRRGQAGRKTGHCSNPV